MWRLRLLLLPAAAVVELALLVTCWAVAMVSAQKAKAMMTWATGTLPSLRWYMNE